MARKKHRRKKRSKSVGKRARKYYVSVKRNKKYRRKRKARGPGVQATMFGPRRRRRKAHRRVRVIHVTAGRRHRRRRHSSGKHTIGALTGAHHSIVGA